MSEIIKIGWAGADITPQGPSMLAGQHFNRLSTEVLDPLKSTALALESGDEKTIIISADLTGFRMPLMEEVRKRITAATGVAGECVFASATHTHTAPQYGPVIPYNERHERRGFVGNRGIDVEQIRKEHPDFVDSEMYFAFLIEKISDAAIRAWDSRSEGSIAFGYGTAVVGENRRLTMRDAGGTMYAYENDPAILNAEGHVDHAVNVLTTYTPEGKLTGMVLNIACPSQACEALSVVSADYWHDVRVEVAKRWGDDVYVLPQCSAAGDISPHKLLHCRADERMMLLRKQQETAIEDWHWANRVYNLDYNAARKKELARRIAVALDDVLPVIAGTAESTPVMKKRFRTIELPPRQITKEEADEAAANIEKAIEKTGDRFSGTIPWLRSVVTRYNDPPESISMELHTLRLGDMAFATNMFELYLDYGDRIKARSNAVQTFLVQLSAGGGSYLPSGRSGKKGYGSVPASSIVTAEGGDMLVEETVKAINGLF